MEVRTEEERTPNHDGGKHTEPNETTPLTEPEYVGGEGPDLVSRALHPPSPYPHSQSNQQARSWSPWPEMPDPPLSLERRHSGFC